ncbi:helix-turn-helix domain-containing protein [Colwellia piezophila]|uniref:helix-turn-helix domain-containing protein n=1 Tax=Colwellia piezophila TaxID=211668 RepID=UPI000362FCB2|nr:helix-turn-helix domain-containing protein [Colwellia piezophila]
MAKRYNPNKCKINRNYTISEIALLYEVHKSTVKAWLRKGLIKIDNKRPYLILGGDLRQFLKDLRGINKRPCELGEIYCLKCRAPREPLQDSIVFESESSTYGRLKGSCNVCDSTMNRYFRLADLAVLQRHFAVILPLQQKRLS